MWHVPCVPSGDNEVTHRKPCVAEIVGVMV
jgi:hypothetical protein